MKIVWMWREMGMMMTQAIDKIHEVRLLVMVTVEPPETPPTFRPPLHTLWYTTLLTPYSTTFFSSGNARGSGGRGGSTADEATAPIVLAPEVIDAFTCVWTGHSAPLLPFLNILLQLFLTLPSSILPLFTPLLFVTCNPDIHKFTNITVIKSVAEVDFRRFGINTLKDNPKAKEQMRMHMLRER